MGEDISPCSSLLFSLSLLPSLLLHTSLPPLTSHSPLFPIPYSYGFPTIETSIIDMPCGGAACSPIELAQVRGYWGKHVFCFFHLLFSSLPSISLYLKSGGNTPLLSHLSSLYLLILDQAFSLPHLLHRGKTFPLSLLSLFSSHSFPTHIPFPLLSLETQ